LSLDYQLFTWVHHLSGDYWLDLLMTKISDERVWIGFAVLVLLYLLRFKKVLQLKLFAILALGVGISDLFTVRVLKPWIARLRPCREFDSIKVINGYCGGDFGFPSTHASNAAIVVTLLWFVLPRPWFFCSAILALIVGVSRIYLGVHYPGDVLGGFIVGVLLGILIWKITIFFFRSFTERLTK
jgi:undecaprenyl-diphosphatase